jgi:hypothetical protein
MWCGGSFVSVDTDHDFEKLFRFMCFQKELAARDKRSKGNPPDGIGKSEKRPRSFVT